MVDGCKLHIGEVLPQTLLENRPMFSVMMSTGKIQYNENATHVFDCKVDTTKTKSTREILEEWLAGLQNPYLFWYHYNPDILALGKDGLIDMTFGYLVGRSGFELKHVVIQTILGKVKLFEGKMVDGRVSGKVSQEMLDHPGWQGRLRIGLSTAITGVAWPDINFDHYVLCTLKNGQLDGLVQIFGILANDPKGHCSDTITPGTTQFSK